ncbi:MAG: acylneuraminate cytidylyltransferase family protein [Candidatus Marinimicrobia bacterium]|nr:acylneuraminate cytidylyltransferase family protein [Candidatus Neomarinimicrobiota bacterium]
MIKEKSVLAFIPARGGSKSIRDKNIRKIAGKEMLAYTIQAAQNSKICDRIIVSTDSKKIADVANKYGAEAPFMRPENLATDAAQMIEVIKHAMQWVEQNDKTYDIFLYLQPTNPLRKGIHIREAFDVFFKKDAYSVVSVNKTGYIPGRVNTLPEHGYMNQFVKQSTMHKNRQELSQYYELNGAIEMIQWEVMKSTWNWYGKRSYPYIIPEPYGIDIDSLMDLRFVQFLVEEGYVE